MLLLKTKIDLFNFKELEAEEWNLAPCVLALNWGALGSGWVKTLPLNCSGKYGGRVHGLKKTNEELNPQRAGPQTPGTKKKQTSASQFLLIIHDFLY